MHSSNTLPKHSRMGLLKSIDLFCKNEVRIYDKIALKQFTDNQLFSEFAAMTNLSMASAVNENQSIVFDETSSPFSKQVENVMRVIGVKISKQAKVTDLEGQVKRYPQLMAEALVATKEQVVSDNYNFAFSTAAPYVGWDGAALISASHTSDGGTLSNISTDPFSWAAVGTAINAMMATKDHKGNPQAIRGPFILHVGTGLFEQAMRYQNSGLQPQTANNDSNFNKTVIQEVVANPFFTNPNMWALQDVKKSNIFLLTRIPLFVEDDYDLKYQRHLLASGEEYVSSFTDWRGVYGSAG